MKKTPTLVSERLVLRPFAEGDGPSIYKWCSSSIVTQFLFWYPHKDEMVSERLLKVWLRKKRHYSWGITLGNDLFGEVEVIKDIQDNECEIGYTLREDMWGKGYAKEALRKVICFLFVSEGYKSIYAETDARNERSGFLLSSLGFHKTGENVPFYVSKKDEHIFLNQYLLFPHDFVASLPVNDENFEKVTKEEIRIHPNLEAVDLIKLAYQNAYGGEHLIEDEEKAKEYLQEELSKVNQEKSEWHDYSIDDDILNDWIKKAKRQAKEMVMMSVEDLVGMSKAATNAAWEKTKYAVLIVIVANILFMLLMR